MNAGRRNGATAQRAERARSQDLHGNAPDKAEVALLLVDVINDLEFDTGPALLRHALPAARKLRLLKQRAKRAGVPCIYANDNFGRWRSDFAAQVQHCLGEETRGAPVVKLLLPEPDDYFVLKPKHSAFYQTCLGVLLEHLEVHTLVLAGFTTDSCLTFTATDAYLRNYTVVVPRDTSASASPQRHAAALAQLHSVLHAEVPRSAQLDFARGGKLRRKGRAPSRARHAARAQKRRRKPR
ncbi:MAG TPA: isochorismatase family cysteine hydrolase [Polyangiales bacterium]